MIAASSTDTAPAPSAKYWRQVDRVRRWRNRKPDLDRRVKRSLHAATIRAQQAGGAEVFAFPIARCDLGAELTPITLAISRSRIALDLLGWVALAWHWHRGALFGSYRQLADLCGCKPSTVEAWAVRLTEAGFIGAEFHFQARDGSGGTAGALSQRAKSYLVGPRLRSMYDRMCARKRRGAEAGTLIPPAPDGGHGGAGGSAARRIKRASLVQSPKTSSAPADSFPPTATRPITAVATAPECVLALEESTRIGSLSDPSRAVSPAGGEGGPVDAGGVHPRLWPGRSDPRGRGRGLPPSAALVADLVPLLERLDAAAPDDATIARGCLDAMRRLTGRQS